MITSAAVKQAKQRETSRAVKLNLLNYHKKSFISQWYGGIFVHLQNKICDYEKRIINISAG
jgi:hypothetical protein